MNNKPLILRVKEAENRIVELINNSNIPAFIMKSSIEKIYNQLANLEQQEYQNALEEEKKKEGNKDEKNIGKTIDKDKQQA